MNKYIVSVMLFSFLGIFSCKSQHNLSVGQFAEALGPQTRILDVRTADEFAEGHLRGAVNVDWYGESFLQHVEDMFDREEPLYVYCRSGRRSEEAARMLSKAGYTVCNMLGGYLAWTEAGREVTRYEVERFLTPKGSAVEITLIQHASLEIRYKGKSIQVDPVAQLTKSIDYAAEFPKADCILVTHEHADHFDQALIGELRKEGTVLLTNDRCAQILGYGIPLGYGGQTTLPELDGIRIEAVPAYNTTQGHLQFHPKGRDNGYVLTLDGFRIYIAGDTEDIPEMAGLKDIDVAFLPCNQPYTMTVQQCVNAAKMIGPKVLIPYHFSQTDIRTLPASLPGMDVRIRQMQ